VIYRCLVGLFGHWGIEAEDPAVARQKLLKDLNEDPNDDITHYSSFVENMKHGEDDGEINDFMDSIDEYSGRPVRERYMALYDFDQRRREKRRREGSGKDTDPSIIPKYLIEDTRESCLDYVRSLAKRHVTNDLNLRVYRATKQCEKLASKSKEQELGQCLITGQSSGADTVRGSGGIRPVLRQVHAQR
jgi:hypothetical protein